MRKLQEIPFRGKYHTIAFLTRAKLITKKILKKENIFYNEMKVTHFYTGFFNILSKK